MTETNLTVRQQPDLSPQTYGEMKEFAAEVSKSDFCPKAFLGKPGQVMIAIQYGSEVGLKPLQALQSMGVINGKPMLYGDGLMALAQAHPACEYINETFDEATMTAKCVSKRRGAEPKTMFFSEADARTAGLWGKAGPWTQYPKRMLQMRARGFNLRDNFADALKGLISYEEAQDYPIDITAETKVLNQTYQGFSDEKMEAIEQEMEARASEGNLGDWWAKDRPSLMVSATEAQRTRIASFKDELKASRPDEQPPRDKPSWECIVCGQKNAGWAKECGRCVNTNSDIMDPEPEKVADPLPDGRSGGPAAGGESIVDWFVRNGQEHVAAGDFDPWWEANKGQIQKKCVGKQWSGAILKIKKGFESKAESPGESLPSPQSSTEAPHLSPDGAALMLELELCFKENGSPAKFWDQKRVAVLALPKAEQEAIEVRVDQMDNQEGA